MDNKQEPLAASTFGIPYHKHNGIDSPKLPFTSIEGSGGNFACGQFTQTGTTGNQSITGVGFKPKLLKITAIGTGNNSGYSVGSANSSVQNVIIRYYSSPNWQGDGLSNYVVDVYNSSGSQYLASLVSFDSDGFTLNWSGTSVSCYVQWEVYS